MIRLHVNVQQATRIEMCEHTLLVFVPHLVIEFCHVLVRLHTDTRRSHDCAWEIVCSSCAGAVLVLCLCTCTDGIDWNTSRLLRAL